MKRLARCSVLGVVLLTGRFGAAAPVDDAASPRLDRAEVPAAGRHGAVLTIARFGRYAVWAKSGQGTAVQLVDRMAGPGPASGAPGSADGRLDAFLERGEYRVLTEGHRKAAGNARLEARAFSEGNTPEPLLVEHKPVEGVLEDFQQRSYWIQIDERRTVALEVAGRCLADLRLWRDGGWLLDTQPASSVETPRVGQPLRVMRLSADLEPGLYLLTAYGGTPLPWAEEGGTPFHLRFGIPTLPEASRRRFTVSAFGVDRYLVPGGASYFRFELPEAVPASMQVGTFDPDNPFVVDGPNAEITKESVPPAAQLAVGRDTKRLHVVTVSGAAGQPYVLQHFEKSDRYLFSASGEYWLSTVHSGHPADSVDATGLLVARSNRSGTAPTAHVEPKASQVVAVSGETGWARRANLLDTLTVFLDVQAAGTYEVLGEGTEMDFVIEPFLLSRPQGYETPAQRGPGSTWKLDRGYHVLRVIPRRKGIATLGVRPWGLLTPLRDLLGGATPAAAPVRAALRFPSVRLDADWSYTLFLNTQPEVSAGVILRPLPLDLRDPLFLSQRPGEAVNVPFRTPETGTLSAQGEDGAPLEIAVDGGAWQHSVDVGPGAHTVAVRNTSAATVGYSLALEPTRLQARAGLPPLPKGAKDALPDFPVLTDAAPERLDLDRTQGATYIVRADKPALYRLESSGLLATEGNLRSRTVPSFVREAQNGVGRNFLLQQYLREGDYQVTVSAQGQSAGHLGLSLSRTPIENGGFLTSYRPARATLAAGRAVSYRFAITRPGTFRVRTLGLGRQFRCRLEDDKGWPVVPPNGPADVTRYFDPGRYRLVILPEATEARVLTLIEPVAGARPLKGKGPHRLPLAARREHVWLEPEEGRERAPDVWTVELPAPVEATIELTGDMEGRLVPEDAAAPAIPVSPRKGYRGPIAAGRYRLEVVSVRRNNRASYAVAVWPTELVTGTSRTVTAPTTLDVSVGAAAFVDLTSFGEADVRGRLYDAQGQLVAASDDRADDWNFHVAAALAPGKYRLQVDPVGKASASTEVAMRIAAATDKPALALPAGLDVSLGQRAHVYPLPALDGGVLLASARSAESVGLSLEAEGPGGWRSVATSTGRLARLEVPLSAEPLRLRLWSLDRRDSPVRLTAVRAVPAAATETDLARGLTLTPVPGSVPALGVAEVRLDRPGLLEWAAGGTLRVSDAAGRAAREASGVVPATGNRLWVIGEADGGAAARGRRRTLATGEAAIVALPPGTTVRYDVATIGREVVLLRATQRAGQPGVAWTQANETTTDARHMAVAEGTATAVALDGASQAAVWSAAPVSSEAEVRLEARSFPRPSTEKAPGVLDGRLEAGKARAFELPRGLKQLRLTLGDGVVGVLSKGDAALSVHGTGDAVDETVATDADRLTLLATGTAEAPFTVERIPASADARVEIAAGRPYETAQVRAGRMRLAVTAASGMLHVRGARGPATLVCASGEIRRGVDIEACNGILHASHGPGIILAWVDRRGEEAQDLWARTGPPSSIEVAPPAAVPLAGEAVSLKVRAGEPALLHMRAAVPTVSRLTRGDGPAETAVHAQGTVLDAYLPAGAGEVRLRGVAGAALSGSAVVTVTGVTPIEEGLGPEVVLAPGDTRVFSFALRQRGPVGVGVRAGSDVVEATLLSADGTRIGAGIVQMPVLEAGTYLLTLHAPEDGAAVRVRPAVAGLAAPGDGPPEDVIRRYVQGEEQAPSFTSTRVVATPRRFTRSAEEPPETLSEEDGMATDEESAEGEGMEETMEGDAEPGAEEGSEETEAP